MVFVFWHRGGYLCWVESRQDGCSLGFLIWVPDYHCAFCAPPGLCRWVFEGLMVPRMGLEISWQSTVKISLLPLSLWSHLWVCIWALSHNRRRHIAHKNTLYLDWKSSDQKRPWLQLYYCLSHMASHAAIQNPMILILCDTFMHFDLAYFERKII